MSVPDSFRFKNCIYLFSKHSGQHILPLVTLCNVPIHKVRQKIQEKRIKSLKIGIFWVFCHFRSQFETISLRKLQETLEKSLLDNIFFLFYLFQRSNTQSTSKIWKKNMLKLFENKKFWGFCQFLCEFETFSIRQLQ